MKKTRKKYVKPKIVEHGKLEDITRKGEMPGDGGSMAYGS